METPGQVAVTGSTGDVVTIAAPTAPSFIEVNEIHLTVDATSTVTVKSGSNTIDKAFLGTGNSYDREKSGFSAGPVLVCNPGEALVINNSAGNIAGYVRYNVRSGAVVTGWGTF